MRCPKYQSGYNVKNGFVIGVQRYKCKECGNSFSLDYSQVVDRDLKVIGFHSIAKLLNVSLVPVINWVKKYGG